MPAEDSVELMILTIGTTYSLIFPILSNSIKHLTFNKSLLGGGMPLAPKNHLGSTLGSKTTPDSYMDISTAARS